MKAAVASAYASGESYEKVISIREDIPKPTRKKGQLLVKVRAVSLAPGDVRVLSGLTKYVQRPKSGFPYVVGGDLVGTVVEPDEKGRFRVGECIIARFSQPPYGALAEYAVVDAGLCAVKPEGLGLAEASTVANSPMVALRMAKDLVRKGDRVLVLGGAGGVGSHLVQLVKRQGASFLAATARTDHVEMLKELGVDRPIDYVSENWSELDEFKENPFDLIIDLAAEGAEGESIKRAQKIAKKGFQGGRVVTLVGPTHVFIIRNFYEMAKLMCCGLAPLSCYSTWTSIDRRYSRFFWYPDGLKEPIQADEWSEIFDAISKGQLKIVLDPAGPFRFSKEGICAALRLQETRHVKGKVAILLE